MGLFHRFQTGKPDITAMQGRKDVSALIDTLQHPDYDVQWKAAAALGTLGKDALHQLHVNLGHPSLEVRLGAIEALGDIRDFSSTEPLSDVLEQDPVSEVRWAAAATIGEIGDPRAIRHLIKALRDPDRFVRYGAATALGQLRWQPKNPKDRAFARIGLQDWDAVGAMGQDAVEPLTSLIHDPDGEVRMRIIETLGRIGGTNSARACTTQLRDPDGAVRWNAVLSGLRCGVQPMAIPMAIARRPRVRKNPLYAAWLNFIMPGYGYTYVGKWWGFTFWQTFLLATLILVLFEGQIMRYIFWQPVPIFVFSPLWVVFALHAYILARRLPEM